MLNQVEIQVTLKVYDGDAVFTSHIVPVPNDPVHDMVIFFVHAPLTSESATDQIVRKAIGDADTQCNRHYYMPFHEISLGDLKQEKAYVVPHAHLVSGVPFTDALLVECYKITYLLDTKFPRHEASEQSVQK